MDRDEALKLLRGGEEGVKEWNERRKAGKETPTLVGANLRAAHLETAEPRGRTFKRGDHRVSSIIPCVLDETVS